MENCLATATRQIETVFTAFFCIIFLTRIREGDGKAHRRRVGSMKQQEERMYQKSLPAKLQARESRKRTAVEKARKLHDAWKCVGGNQNMHPSAAQVKKMKGPEVDQYLRVWQVHKPNHIEPRITLGGKVEERKARLLQLVQLYPRTAAPAIEVSHDENMDDVDAGSDGDGEEHHETGEGFGPALDSGPQFAASGTFGT